MVAVTIIPKAGHTYLLESSKSQCGSDDYFGIASFAGFQVIRIIFPH